MAAAESGTAFGLTAITKFGWIKLFTLGAAAAGAALMAIFRPPQSRKEVFYQGLVALGSSLLFGNTIAQALSSSFDFLNQTGTFEDHVQYLVSVHALVGALSWGVFGGLAHFRDKVYSQSIDKTIKNE